MKKMMLILALIAGISPVLATETENDNNIRLLKLEHDKKMQQQQQEQKDKQFKAGLKIAAGLGLAGVTYYTVKYGMGALVLGAIIGALDSSSGGMKFGAILAAPVFATAIGSGYYSGKFLLNGSSEMWDAVIAHELAKKSAEQQ
jgi:hypothetical protein